QENYFNTPLANMDYLPSLYSTKNISPPKEFRVNPAYFHLVYLPFGFISVVPFYLMFNELFGFFDVRIVYLICYIGSLLFALSLVPKHLKFSFLSLFSLNPLLSTFVISGHNDILTIFLLIVSIFLASKKKYLISAIPIGLAL